MSHTSVRKVEFKDEAVLAAAVQRIGGTVVGQGTHSLYSSTETGLGFKLPGWRYPLILKQSGELAFDSYNGSWGNEKDLDKLKAEYALSVAETVAGSMGWMTERMADGNLKVYAGGGEVVVSREGVVDAGGFVGPACQSIVDQLGAAIGQETASYCKPEAAIGLNSAQIQGQ